jgi:hypothetical protein
MTKKADMTGTRALNPLGLPVGWAVVALMAFSFSFIDMRLMHDRCGYASLRLRADTASGRCGTSEVVMNTWKCGAFATASEKRS